MKSTSTLLMRQAYLNSWLENENDVDSLAIYSELESVSEMLKLNELFNR